jgi:subtilase family serine protease
VSLQLEELETRALLSAGGVTPEPATTTGRTPPGGVQPLLAVTPQQLPGSIPGYSPQAIQQAYGVSSLLSSGTNGKGETIAIVDASYDPNIQGDAKAFNSQFNLPQFNQPGGPTLKVVTTGGGPATASLGENANWAAETALDVEWAHSIAPDANILLVEAPLTVNQTLQLNDLSGAVKYAASVPGVVTVSMSWGFTEFPGESGASYDGVLTNPKVTYVAASGDSSAFFGPIWPATSPYVLAVGGTNLQTTVSGGQTVYASETGWFGSGGGFASFEGEPSFQTNTVGPTGSRLTPDVSFDANPNTGVAIYDSFQRSTPWLEVGGTSVGTPVWAAIVTLADQQKGGTPLGTYQVETTLYNTLNNSTTYNKDFHDITSGYNGYSAGPGYDLVTGLGSPKVNAIVPLLASTTFPPGLPGISGAGTAGFGSTTFFGLFTGSRPGGGLFTATGSPDIPASPGGVTGSSGNLAGTSNALAVSPVAGTSALGSTGSATVVNDLVLTTFSLAAQGAPTAFLGGGATLLGATNTPAPQAGTLFGASGWSRSGNGWQSDSSGMHYPAVDVAAGELASSSIADPETQPDTDSPGQDMPVVDMAVPVAPEGAGEDSD